MEQTAENGTVIASQLKDGECGACDERKTKGNTDDRLLSVDQDSALPGIYYGNDDQGWTQNGGRCFKQNSETGSLSMKDCLLILDNDSGPNTVYPLIDEVTIGRSSESSISLSHNSVSRNHARVSLQEGAWTLEDLGSANGTVFKGKRVDKVVLASGDVFQIGIFTFRYVEKDIPEARDQFFDTITIL